MPRTLVRQKPAAKGGLHLRPDAWRAIAACVLLAICVLVVFSPTLDQGFSDYDDPIYVSGEPHVSAGLTWSGLRWAFTNGPVGELYPLSMLSHMLDCQIYGAKNPGGHHLTNVLLHAAAAVTLLLTLWRMTGQRAVPEAAQASGGRVAPAGPSATTLWPSFLAAALFALHPLRVESVAWLSERRDVLSGLFFMLTLLAYDGYVRHGRSVWRYLAVMVCFTLGLLAKPMLVTLPPLLLLLDYWPLGRFGDAQRLSPTSQPRASLLWLVLEKLPLAALAAGAAAITMLTHGKFPDPVSMPERLANAAVSYAIYIGQLFVPVNLSPYYSHPEGGWAAWQVAGAIALLLAITAAAVIFRRAYPYLLVGWFWYLGLLVPVLGITSVGQHSRADRYTYLSQIGLYIALAWGASQWAGTRPARRRVLAIGSALLLTALAAVTWHQIGFWQTPIALWQHALACDPDNVMAHYSLGNALYSRGDTAAAETQYRQALESGPNRRRIYVTLQSQASYQLGLIAAQKKHIDEAIARFRAAIDMYADYVQAHMELGRLLAGQGNLAEALPHFQRSAELQPQNPDIPTAAAFALAENGKTDEAIEYFQKALAIDERAGVAQLNLALLLEQRGDVDGAILHFRRAIEINPGVVVAYQHIVALLRRQGKTVEADKYEEAGKRAILRSTH